MISAYDWQFRECRYHYRRLKIFRDFTGDQVDHRFEHQTTLPRGTDISGASIYDAALGNSRPTSVSVGPPRIQRHVRFWERDGSGEPRAGALK